ncbi:SDR family NAD(P)-dependent oxidoreductase, partial [Nonomuraea aridisoli]|uniref:SDR family NAD(P)-dependent oxidoreductase n=1 Tax=Nonomuraea aridisoli TaxID=2070368 RepID=UPI0034DD206A
MTRVRPSAAHHGAKPALPVDLSGRTALVTGSCSGIGAATAQALLESGAEVVVNGRDAAGVEEGWP